MTGSKPFGGLGAERGSWRAYAEVCAHIASVEEAEHLPTYANLGGEAPLGSDQRVLESEDHDAGP